MNNQTEDLNPLQSSQVKDSGAPGEPQAGAAKKVFVEPEVSFPLDVLEATTFFQTSDSNSQQK